MTMRKQNVIKRGSDYARKRNYSAEYVVTREAIVTLILYGPHQQNLVRICMNWYAYIKTLICKTYSFGSAIIVFCHIFNPSDASEVCVKITTGTKTHNDGTLKVEIDGFVAADASHEKGGVAMDSCFCHIKTVEISNPSSNGWSGRISIKDNGNPTSITCIGCSKSLSLPCGNIAVEGNWDSKMAHTQCVGGNTCSLSWQIRGILATVKHIPTHVLEY